jgi:hypothetical protein
VSATLVASRYRLGAALGRSALGTTHLGTDMRSGADCVIKRFALEPGEGARLAALVEAERPKLLALSHPNLARVLECELAGDELCMVQQKVEGKNLDQQAAAGQRVRPNQAAAVGLAVARALQHVHSAGLVHGAVRPSNILRSPFGKVFLVDLWGPLATRSMAPSPRGWGAPEGIASPAADVYALGASLVFLLTHQDPCALLEDGRIVYRREARVPAPLAEVLDGLLEPDPTRRLGAREAVVALDRIAPAEVPQRPPWMALAIAGAAILLFTGGLASRRRGLPPPAVEAPVALAPRVVAPGAVASAPSPPSPEPSSPRLAQATTLPELNAALAAEARAEPTRLTISPTGVWASATATEAWRAALASPALAGVEQLRIEARLTRAAVVELSSAANLRSLRALTLVHTGIGDDGVLTLADSRLARQLEQLELEGEELSAAAARALARSTKLLRLRELRLPGNHLGDDGATELARSQALRSLERLDLRDNALPEGSARLMVLALGHGGLPALAHLALSGNQLAPGDVAALAGAPRTFQFEVREGELRASAGPDAGRPAESARAERQ